MRPTWSFTIGGGPEKVNHASVIIRNCIYVFGGFSLSEDFNNLKPIDVHIFNTKLFKWKKLKQSDELIHDFQYGEVPFMRYGHAAVSHDNQWIYLWGGRNNMNGHCTTLFRFNIKQMKWERVPTEGISPTARDGHTMAVYQHNVFVFGGFDSTVRKFSNDHHKLNLKTFYWERLVSNGAIPPARDFHACVVHKGSMYVCGGRKMSSHDSLTLQEADIDLWEFSIHDNNWVQHSSEILDVPLNRRSHSTFVHEEHMYLFGGFNGEKRKHFNDLWKYCFGNQKWTQVKTFGEPPSPRRRHTSSIGVGKKVYIFGGTSPSIKNLDFEELLVDQSTVHILDFEPSLKTMSSKNHTVEY